MFGRSIQVKLVKTPKSEESVETPLISSDDVKKAAQYIVVGSLILIAANTASKILINKLS